MGCVRATGHRRTRCQRHRQQSRHAKGPSFPFAQPAATAVNTRYAGGVETGLSAAPRASGFPGLALDRLPDVPGSDRKPVGPQLLCQRSYLRQLVPRARPSNSFVPPEGLLAVGQQRWPPAILAPPRRAPMARPTSASSPLKSLIDLSILPSSVCEAIAVPCRCQGDSSGPRAPNGKASGTRSRTRPGAVTTLQTRRRSSVSRRYAIIVLKSP